MAMHAWGLRLQMFKICASCLTVDVWISATFHKNYKTDRNWCEYMSCIHPYVTQRLHQQHAEDRAVLTMAMILWGQRCLSSIFPLFTGRKAPPTPLSSYSTNGWISFNSNLFLIQGVGFSYISYAAKIPLVVQSMTLSAGFGLLCPCIVGKTMTFWSLSVSYTVYLMIQFLSGMCHRDKWKAATDSYDVLEPCVFALKLCSSSSILFLLPCEICVYPTNWWG